MLDPGAVLNDVAAVILSLGIIGAFLWRVVAKPHVTKFVQSVKAVEHAVTTNGHKDPKNPTMLDKFAYLHDAQERMEANQRRIEAKLDRHIDWADRQVVRLDRLEGGTS